MEKIFLKNLNYYYPSSTDNMKTHYYVMYKNVHGGSHVFDECINQKLVSGRLSIHALIFGMAPIFSIWACIGGASLLLADKLEHRSYTTMSANDNLSPTKNPFLPFSFIILSNDFIRLGKTSVVNLAWRSAFFPASFSKNTLICSDIASPHIPMIASVAFSPQRSSLP
uniref:Uncharacterized protein n=1 Tax=Pinctada fucata TaxID=50426 RepID=A0A194ALX5_PINFU